MDSAAAYKTPNATIRRRDGTYRSGLATTAMIIAMVVPGGIILVEARSLLVPLAIAVLIYLRSGAALLSLGVGTLIGAGLPHLVVNFFIKQFQELLHLRRTLRS